MPEGMLHRHVSRRRFLQSVPPFMVAAAGVLFLLPGKLRAGLGKEEDTRKYVCMICGYVYDPAKGDPTQGISPGTPFSKLPDWWICPECGADKGAFNEWH